MKRLRALWCVVRGHDDVTMQVGDERSGGGRIEICLRCHRKQNVVEWERQI